LSQNELKHDNLPAILADDIAIGEFVNHCQAAPAGRALL
jgi:hypothetical protein